MNTPILRETPTMLVKMKSFISNPKVIFFSKLLFFVLAANVYMQSMHRKANIGYPNWDIHHFTYMSSPKDVFNSEPAVDGYQTYGPLFNYIVSTVGPFEIRQNYFTNLAWMFVWLGIFYIFLKSCDIANPFLFVAIILGGFNFPSYAYAPWPIVLWCLSNPKTRFDKYTHIICGISYVSCMLMFKFSYGFIAFAQLIVWVFLNEKNYSIAFLSSFKWMLSIVLISVGLYFLSTDGSFLSLFDYVYISFKDTGSYPSLLIEPLSFMEGDLLFYWPVILFILWILSAAIKTGHSAWWLPVMLLPISYAEFKHSYVRCDYTNLKGTFYVTGVLAFCLLIRYYHQKKVRWGLAAIIVFFIISTYAGTIPRNIPWRHPRHVWLKTPEQDREQWLKAKEEAKLDLDNYLNNYDWVKQHVENDSLAATPAALCLSLLSSQPHIFKSAQSYYNIPLHEEFDLKSIKSMNTKWIIFENRILDSRFPASHAPKFFMELLANYKLIENREHQFLLSKEEQPKTWNKLEEKQFYLKDGSGSIQLNLPLSKVGIFIKSEPMDDLTYRLQKFLLRGERLKVQWNSEEFVISLLELKNGVFVVPKLSTFWKKNKVHQPIELNFSGPISSDYKYDPVHLLPILNLDTTVKVELYRLEE